MDDKVLDKLTQLAEKMGTTAHELFDAARARADELPWPAGDGPTLQEMLASSQAVRLTMLALRRELATLPTYSRASGGV